MWFVVLHSVFVLLQTADAFQSLTAQITQLLEADSKSSIKRPQIDSKLDQSASNLHIEQLNITSTPLANSQQLQNARLTQESIYCLGFNQCFGSCLKSYCSCSGGAYGDKCQYNCYYCSRHGECLGDGKCSCQYPWTGDQCTDSPDSNGDSSNTAMAALYVVLLVISIGTVIAYLVYRRLNNKYIRNPSPNQPQSPTDRNQIRSTNLSIVQARHSVPTQEPYIVHLHTLQEQIRTQTQIQQEFRENKEQIEEENVCSICLENISLHFQKKIKCPYKHIFHRDCINQWIRFHKTCPQCRGHIDL